MTEIRNLSGLRGIAMSELRCELLLQIGRAAAQAVNRNSERSPVFYLCHDPRRSAEALEAALSAGICAGGGTVHCLGVLPAPALSLLMTAEDADCGIALAGDDLTYEYSGVRFYRKGGFPMDADLLARIASLLPESEAMPPKSHRSCGMIVRENDAARRYLLLAAHRARSGDRSRVLRIALDCAHGAASVTAEALMRLIGVQVLMLHRTPDGTNINRGCGVRQPDALAELVREQHCDAGFAFDGSGFRCIALDETGEQISAERLLAVLCEHAYKQDANQLCQNGIAVPENSNLGLLRYAAGRHIPIRRMHTDSAALCEMPAQERPAFAADASGGLYLPENAVPDALLTAAAAVGVMRDTGQSLSELASVMEPAPQVTVPVRIPPYWREIWRNDPEISGYIADCESVLGETGRLRIREHSREPLLSIVLEGSDFRQLNTLAFALAEHISVCMQPHTRT